MECRQERISTEKRLGLVVKCAVWIVNELASTETTGDAAVLDHDTVDDYTIINSQGHRTTRQALLKAVRDGSYKVESKDVEILEVRS